MSKVTEFLYKSNDGKSSSSKLWFTLTNTAILYLYVIIGQRVAASAEPNLEGFAILTLVISVIVTGNKIANDIIKIKLGAGAGNVDNTDSKPLSKVRGSSNNNSTE